MDKRQVMKILSQVYDPDYKDRSIVDLGLVTENDVVIEGDKVEVTYTLTAAVCPFSAAIGLMIKHALETKLGVPATVKIKQGHYQEKQVTEVLQDAAKSRELMDKMKQFGVLDSCVRFDDETTNIDRGQGI